MKLDIEVTPKHIHEGHRNTCCSCPVALAILPPLIKGPRVFPEITYVSVHLKDGHLTFQETKTSPKYVHKFSLPEIARKFVAAFQNGDTVGPISFSIDAEQAYMKSASRSTL